MELFFLLLVFWACCGVGAAYIATSRGANGCLWLVVGFFLGPIGLAMAFAARPDVQNPATGNGIRGPSATTKVCPFCAETILAAAIKCRFCGEFLPAPAQSAQPINMQAAQSTETISNSPPAVDLKAEAVKPASKADTGEWLAWVFIGVPVTIIAVILTVAIYKGSPVSKSPEVESVNCVSARVESRWHLEHSPAWRITDTQVLACEWAGKDLYRVTGESKSRGRFVCLARGDTSKANWDVSCTPADGEARK